MREYNHDASSLFEALNLSEEEIEFVKEETAKLIKKNYDKKSMTMAHISDLDCEDVVKLMIFRAYVELESFADAATDADDLKRRMSAIKESLETAGETVEEFNEDEF